MTDAGLSLAYAAQCCVNSYADKPDGLVIDAIGNLRLVLQGDEATIRGTMPSSVDNWQEDFDVALRKLADHPTLGACPEGPLAAAVALYDLLPVKPRRVMGHSLGGQVAAELAGLLVADGHPPASVVMIDPPKPGGATLRQLLDAVPDVRVVRLAGSIVTDWPLENSLMFARLPVIDAGEWTIDPVEAHSITRAAAWLAAHAW